MFVLLSLWFARHYCLPGEKGPLFVISDLWLSVQKQNKLSIDDSERWCGLPILQRVSFTTFKEDNFPGSSSISSVYEEYQGREVVPRMSTIASPTYFIIYDIQCCERVCIFVTDDGGNVKKFNEIYLLNNGYTTYFNIIIIVIIIETVILIMPTVTFYIQSTIQHYYENCHLID